MREIIFRAKRVDNGEWVEGDLLTNNGDPIIVRQVNRDYISTTDVGAGKHWYISTPAFKVDPDTVSQYTGLKDREGNKIFEGDIVENEFGTKEIKWMNGGFVYLEGVMVIPMSYSPVAIEKLKIIGNRWGNPELLQ